MACATWMDGLERRLLLSGGPLQISEVQLPDGSLQLQVAGTTDSDDIRISRQLDQTLLISNGDPALLENFSITEAGAYDSILIHSGAGDDLVSADATMDIPLVIYGDDGNDTLLGAAAGDRIYGGLGADSLLGAAGDDYLVDIGGSSFDTLTGGDGRDTFWLDADSTEIIADDIKSEHAFTHRVGSFYDYRYKDEFGATQYTMIGKDLLGEDLVDPKPDFPAEWVNFSDHSLFPSTGPSQDDIEQGAMGDCFLLATLSAVAERNPRALTNRMMDLGDGTYVVQLRRDTMKYYVRVDGDLPVYPGTQSLLYANLGSQLSLWPAIFEKAYAIFRRGSADYSSLDSGWMDEVHAALGRRSQVKSHFKTDEAMVKWFKKQLKQGRAVTFGTRNSFGAPVISNHAYSVDSIVYDGKKVAGLRVRNPWGIVGVSSFATAGQDDGYVTLTPTQLRGVMWLAFSARA